MFAQETIVSGDQASVEQLNLVDIPESNLIKYIEVNFCSGENRSVATSVEAGKSSRLCVEWVNKLNT